MSIALRSLLVCGAAGLALAACTAEVPEACVTADCVQSALGAGSNADAGSDGAYGTAANAHVCTGGYNFTPSGSGKLTVPGPYPGTTMQLELAAPPGCDQKFVLALFGGGWAEGHSEAMDYLIPAMAANGIVYGSLEYTTNVPMNIITDEVRTALAEVRGAAGQLGIDPNKMGVMGFSAGGQLAYQGGFTDGHLRWIGGLYGPTDMTELEAADCNPNTPVGQTDIAAGICTVVLNVMGNTLPGNNQGYYNGQSPIFSAPNLANDPLHPGVFVGYSTDDVIVTSPQQQALVGELHSLGAPVAVDQTTNFHGANILQLSLDAVNNAKAVLDSPPAPYTPGPLTVPAGGFRVNGDLYYSNGSHYCHFADGAYYKIVFGALDPLALPDYLRTPDMAFDGDCAEVAPAGPFSVNGVDLYFSNGSHYCHFGDFPWYAFTQGNRPVASLPSYGRTPNMPYDGDCAEVWPQGDWRINGDLYHSNGSHYCHYRLWLSATPPLSLFDFARPPDMPYDGDCQQALPAGPFAVNGVDLYFSNGSHYCHFGDYPWYAFTQANRPVSSLPNYPNTPGEPYDGNCAEVWPAGDWRVNTDLYHSNGSHYCHYTTWTSPVPPLSLFDFARLPDMPNDGDCH